MMIIVYLLLAWLLPFVINFICAKKMWINFEDEGGVDIFITLSFLPFLNWFISLIIIVEVVSKNIKDKYGYK